uniref:Uncharacterized protein n=1 Tax=Anopheles triannulatus TaxID=58253 RepID=A0A2M4A0C1_9DIPT
MVLPVVGQRLVELAVLFLRDIVSVARPDRLRLVQFLVLGVLHLHRLLLLVLLVLIILSVLQLWLIVLLILLLLLFLLVILGLIVAHLLLALLLHQQLDRIADELRVLVDDLLDLALLQVLQLVLLDVQHNLGTAAKRLSAIGAHGERTSGRRLPHVLLVVVVL